MQQVLRLMNGEAARHCSLHNKQNHLAINSLSQWIRTPRSSSAKRSSGALNLFYCNASTCRFCVQEQSVARKTFSPVSCCMHEFLMKLIAKISTWVKFFCQRNGLRWCAAFLYILVSWFLDAVWCWKKTGMYLCEKETERKERGFTTWFLWLRLFVSKIAKHWNDSLCQCLLAELS